jgi:hypothetical protein
MQALLDRGWGVYYTDTDSLHTNCPPGSFPGQLGSACGEWQIEAGPVEALYLGPKFYGLRRPRGKQEPIPDGWRVSGETLFKVVCQGFDPRIIGWHHLQKALAGEEPTLTARAGITGALGAMSGQAPQVRTVTRTLRPLTGGKRREPSGWLYYPESKNHG